MLTAISCVAGEIDGLHDGSTLLQSVVCRLLALAWRALAVVSIASLAACFYCTLQLSRQGAYDIKRVNLFQAVTIYVFRHCHGQSLSAECQKNYVDLKEQIDRLCKLGVFQNGMGAARTSVYDVEQAFLDWEKNGKKIG